VVGANERLTVGFIGVGGQGYQAHVGNVVKYGAEQNVVGAAVCDVWSKHRDRAAAELELGVENAYADYRSVLDRKDIDAVFVGTVDHWHSRISVDALDAGKHVYCEKPMTRYLNEAFDVLEAVDRTGLVFQLGSQYTTEAKWHKAAELIGAGMIGAPVLAQNSYARNEPEGEWNYDIDPECTEETLNWTGWLGPVSDRPFSPDEYFRWRKYYPYCAGILGDLLAHRIAPLLVATGNPEFPSRVACLGTRKVTPDRDVPDQTQVLVEFPSGLSLVVMGSTVNEQGFDQVFRGHEATLYMGSNALELRPERPFADLVDQQTFDDLQPGPSVPAHMVNFYDAVRTDIEANANIDVAVKTQTIISLAEMSERLGEMMHFDAETRTVYAGSGREIEPITYGTLEIS
jgi:predicted dehydrogenase